MSNESSLPAGRTAIGVVRMGNTVRRPMGPHASFTHAVLKLLEQKEFSYAPRFLGIDEQGREILSFMEGEVPHGNHNWTDMELKKIVRMIKEFHDVTEGTELAGEKEVVCHNDLAPWNVVLDKDEPVAFIDYDDAAPGSRVDDLGYFMWTFIKLGEDISIDLQVERMKMLCETYGIRGGARLIDAIHRQQARILTKRKALVHNASNEEDREFSRERIISIYTDMNWLVSHRKALEHAME